MLIRSCGANGGTRSDDDQDNDDYPKVMTFQRPVPRIMMIEGTPALMMMTPPTPLYEVKAPAPGIMMHDDADDDHDDYLLWKISLLMCSKNRLLSTNRRPASEF